jgi:YkoY family integral membrane protein
MEAETVESLTPLLQAADQWSEVLLLLPLLVGLEAVLSADNAIALAAISRRLHDPARQRQALNLGLLLALLFRLGLIAAARWVLAFWPLQLLAAGYLLWLSGRHLLGLDGEGDGAGEGEGLTEAEGQANGAAEVRDAAEDYSEAEGTGAAVGTGEGTGEGSGEGTAASTPPGPAHGLPGLGSVVLTLALTDLAFSLDSVAAAVAVTDRLLLVMAGGVIGVVALRLTAELFIRWLEVFRHLETAGYLAVGLVGLRLLVRLAFPALEIPDWALLASVVLLFLWGFSARRLPSVPADAGAAPLPLDPP